MDQAIASKSIAPAKTCASLPSLFSLYGILSQYAPLPYVGLSTFTGKVGADTTLSAGGAGYAFIAPTNQSEQLCLWGARSEARLTPLFSSRCEDLRDCSDLPRITLRRRERRLVPELCDQGAEGKLDSRRRFAASAHLRPVERRRHRRHWKLHRVQGGFPSSFCSPREFTTKKKSFQTCLWLTTVFADFHLCPHEHDQLLLHSCPSQPQADQDKPHRRCNRWTSLGRLSSFFRFYCTQARRLQSHVFCSRSKVLHSRPSISEKRLRV